jgi:hypothetical protein
VGCVGTHAEGGYRSTQSVELTGTREDVNGSLCLLGQGEVVRGESLVILVELHAKIDIIGSC